MTFFGSLKKMSAFGRSSVILGPMAAVNLEWQSEIWAALA